MMNCEGVPKGEALKTCTGCGEPKPLHDFYKEKSRKSVKSHCKGRSIAKPKAWGKANVEKRRASRMDQYHKRKLDTPGFLRQRHLMSSYGMSVEEWDTLFEKQGKACRVCKSTSPRTKNAVWHTDHKHETGKVRGILCSHCNTMLGMAHEDPAIMLAGVDYLKKRDG